MVLVMYNHFDSYLGLEYELEPSVLFDHYK